MQNRLRGPVVAAILALAPALLASVEELVPRSAMAKLQDASPDARELRLERFPLDGRLETLVLEEFDVLAPNAVIERFDDQLTPHRVKPAPMRQFRGYVEGEPESLVYLSTGPHSDGIIINRDRKFIVKQRRERGGKEDFFVEEIPLIDELDAANNGFRCEALNAHDDPIDGFLPRSLTGIATPEAVPPWPSATATSVLNLAISTDSALYANFGSNIVSVEAYARNLVGAASVIYKRDLRTELRIVYLQLTQGSDPWTINPGSNGSTTLNALAEYGDYWHNSPPSNLGRSAAVLVSGQPQMAGVAWINTICDGDFLCSSGNCGSAVLDGHYGGGYAYCGGVGTTVAEQTPPNPDGNAGGQFPYQINTSSSWGLLQFSHELGHVVQSPHTHCVALSAAEQSQYGVARSFVDVCYSSSGTCYVGTTGVPAEKGTIMSYCHLLAGGTSNVRWLFGRSSEASEVITLHMRANLDSETPSGLSVITAPSTVPAGVSNAASVTATAGLTFDWTITNGTFSGGGTTASGASVSFVGATNPVTLRVYATNSQGCAITDYKSVTVNASAVAAPTNVVATASSATTIGVTWSVVADAVSYQIDRRTGAIWSQIGTSPTNSYNDATAIGGTAYLYRVRAVDGNAAASGNSAVDLATGIVFTDTTIIAGTTTAKSSHFSELRTAVNAVRALAALSPSSFTDPALSSSVNIKAAHVTELRTAIDTARTALGLGATAYSDAAPTGVSIKAAHVNELRGAVR